MIIRELVAEVPALWEDFAKAIGMQALRDAYGPHWPRPMIAFERVFEFSEGGERVAWGSLLHDPAERLAWHAHGIWPSFQDQRRTKEVSAYLVDYAFTRWPVVTVAAKILETNPRYQAFFKKRQHDPAFAWRYAGSITMPWPGYDVYCFTRERWALERNQKDVTMD